MNVIPSHVSIKGDTRSFTDPTLQKIKKAIEQIVKGQCLSAGVEYKFHFSTSFATTINTPTETNIAIKAATKTVGVAKVNGKGHPLTVSEDFAFMLQKKKGCYVLIGNGMDGSNGMPLHNPHYNFNDEILMIGAQYWVNLVGEQLMNE